MQRLRLSSTRPTASTSRLSPIPSPTSSSPGYSGLTQEDYDTLSEIAPVVAYPETAWGTPWREMIEINSKAIGLAEEGEELVKDLETEIDSAVADHPAIKDMSTMFLTHVDPSDLSR